MFEIQWYANKQRKTIPLGKKYSEKTARDMLEVVNALLYNQVNGIEYPSKRTACWIESASPEIREKLAKAGLVEVLPEHTVKEVWDTFLVQKELDQKAGRIKESTIEQYGIARNRFFERFKESDRLADLSKETLTKWKAELLTRFKQSTVASQLKHVKSVFTWAVGQGWIEKSPLDGIGRGSFVNKANDLIIPMDWYHKLLAAAPCQDWRTIIALARIGGLRCPSEIMRLRWEDVLWEQDRFRVCSPKTEHHAGKESRLVPIFPELKTELEALFFDKASEGKEYVINRYRNPKQNLGTTFEKIVRRAGLPEIPRPFDNMRMTRSNEVYNRWGAFKESQWIGHSARVRQDHYLMLTDDDFSDASKVSTGFPVKAPKRQRDTEIVGR
jgi:integrase